MSTQNSSLNMAQAALQAKRMAGELERLDALEKAKRNPTSLRLAINAECYSCMGAGTNPNTPNLIRQCPSQTCPLYTVRPYQPDRTGRQKLTIAIRNKCFDCVGRYDDPSAKRRVRDCSHDCPLQPVRPWQKIKGRTA